MRTLKTIITIIIIIAAVCCTTGEVTLDSLHEELATLTSKLDVKQPDLVYGMTSVEWISLSLLSVNVGMTVSTLAVLLYLLVRQ